MTPDPQLSDLYTLNRIADGWAEARSHIEGLDDSEIRSSYMRMVTGTADAMLLAWAAGGINPTAPTLNISMSVVGLVDTITDEFKGNPILAAFYEVRDSMVMLNEAQLVAAACGEIARRIIAGEIEPPEPEETP